MNCERQSNCAAMPAHTHTHTHTHTELSMSWPHLTKANRETERFSLCTIESQERSASLVQYLAPAASCLRPQGILLRGLQKTYEHSASLTTYYYEAFRRHTNIPFRHNPAMKTKADTLLQAYWRGPEEVATAIVPPSSFATLSSKTDVVGFIMRV